MMSADPGDRAPYPITARDRERLDQIETQLWRDDPGLAEALRRWRLPPECVDGHGLDTVVPAWAGVTLLSAFLLWIGGPAVGLLPAILAVRSMARGARGRPR